jgi:alkyl hydroperoxide reductase subunit AhpC
MIVGSQAPDFAADAFVKGEIKSINLQDYKGKWVVLLFYSGDFTFV